LRGADDRLGDKVETVAGCLAVGIDERLESPRDRLELSREELDPTSFLDVFCLDTQGEVVSIGRRSGSADLALFDFLTLSDCISSSEIIKGSTSKNLRLIVLFSFAPCGDLVFLENQIFIRLPLSK